VSSVEIGIFGDNRVIIMIINCYKPSIILLSNEIQIKKMSCGAEHSLLLSHVIGFEDMIMKND
jgi:hypothetical protein